MIVPRVYGDSGSFFDKASLHDPVSILHHFTILNAIGFYAPLYIMYRGYYNWHPQLRIEHQDHVETLTLTKCTPAWDMYMCNL